MIHQAELVVWDKGQVKSRYALTSGVLSVGRSAENDVVLEGERVSRQHAVITVTREMIHIEDRSSGNGLFHRGGRVKSLQAIDGDLVFLDPYVLEFKVRRVEARKDPPTRTTLRPRLTCELVLLTAPGGPKAFALDTEITCIGRGEQRRIQVVDEAASRKHAEVVWKDGKYVVRDTHSANGTYLNGRRIYEAVLQPGDQIRVGAAVLEYREGPPKSVRVSSAPGHASI